MSYTEIKTSQATFRLLHRLEGKQIFPTDLPENFAAVLIEMVHTRPIEDPNLRIQASLTGLEQIPDLSFLVKKIQKTNAQVYFGDLAENQLISNQRDLSLLFLELASGIVLFSLAVYSLFRKKKKNESGEKNIIPKGADLQPDSKGIESKRHPELVSGSRRKERPSFLINILFLFILALWFLSSAVEILGLFLVNVAGNTAKKGFLKAVRDSVAIVSNLHPEKTVVFLRNLVLAEKAWEIAILENKKGEKPTIILDLHFGHAGIAKMLRWPPRLRQLILKLYKPFIRAILKNPVQRDYFARLTSVSWQSDHWHLERNYLADSLEFL